MARRQLTRMELRMEDLQEYEVMKKASERKKYGAESLDNSVLGLQLLTNQKSRPGMNKDVLYERIGYNPALRNPQ